LIAVIGWILVIALFIIGMLGAVYPVLPGVLAIYAAFFVYGFMIGFGELGLWFWLIQTVILAAVIIADYAVSAWGVKAFGGSRASVIGSTIGIIIGPFAIPAVGLIAGPLIGAFVGEWIAGTPPRLAWKAAVGALVGLFSSTAVKIVMQLAMIMLFALWLIF